MLHIFRTDHETGTSNLEAKLLQHIVSMREAIIYKVFLDLQKAYDALYQYRCLKIIMA